MPINKETIISVFDDKLTLMQWLKTINKALEDAVLTGVEITKKGNATLSFKFTFEDGTFLETNDIVLQQGESVDGARIVNNHLELHLTNGTWLDAGVLFTGSLDLEGTLQATHAKIFENIEDSQGHKRFIEGEMNTGTIAGVNFVYAKWSLSGTHLIMVLAGTIDANTTIPDNIGFGACVGLPQWVMDKIYGVSDQLVETKQIDVYKDNAAWVTEPLKASLVKGDYMLINNISGQQTFNNNGSFRIQFDLLIDNE